MLYNYSDIDIQFTFEDIPIQALYIVSGPASVSVPAHSHGIGCYEIHYIPSGKGTLKAEGFFYDLEPGTIYVTGPHVEHTQIPVYSDPMQEYCVYLKIRDTAKQQNLSPIMDAFTSTSFWIGKDTQEIQNLMVQLFHELNNHYFGYLSQAGLLLSQLLVCMVRNYKQHRKSQTYYPQNNLANLYSFIIENYFLYEYHSLSLQGLANKLKLSSRQTQRLLAEYYGKNFQQKKTEARMSMAAILLADHKRSITSIAEELGYSSSEHFSTAFRKYYNVSPREFRKRV